MRQHYQTVHYFPKMPRYVDRKEVPSKLRQLKTYLAKAKEKSAKSKEVCYLCKNNNDLDKCQESMKRSVEENRKFLFQNKFCYGCYMSISTDHNSRSCKQMRVYGTFREKHPTRLQASKGSKKNNDAADGTLACATIKLKSKVVSMCCASERLM